MTTPGNSSADAVDFIGHTLTEFAQGAHTYLMPQERLERFLAEAIMTMMADEAGLSIAAFQGEHLLLPIDHHLSRSPSKPSREELGCHAANGDKVDKDRSWRSLISTSSGAQPIARACLCFGQAASERRSAAAQVEPGPARNQLVMHAPMAMQYTGPGRVYIHTKELLAL